VSLFAQVRDLAVAVGRGATCLSLEQLDAAIAEGEAATTAAAATDPTLLMRGGESLEQQMAYLRAFRSFRAALEEFRS
jgi:hypothetical protein